MDNKGVMKLLGVFEDSETIYLVMEHLKGGDLYKKVCLNRRI